MTKQHLRVFRDLLSSSDMDVRMEAGENLALLHESRIILGLVGGADDHANGGGRGGSGGAGSGTADMEGDEEGGEDEGDDVEDEEEELEEEEALDLTVLWEEVVEEMKGFITESSKKVRYAFKKSEFLLHLTKMKIKSSVVRWKCEI